MPALSIRLPAVVRFLGYRHESFYGDRQDARRPSAVGRRSSQFDPKIRNRWRCVRTSQTSGLVADRTGSVQQRGAYRDRSDGQPRWEHTQSLHTNASTKPSRCRPIFRARIARNTQIYIQEETNITCAVDPWAGSYYVESLTDEIVHKARDLIQEVESLAVRPKPSKPVFRKCVSRRRPPANRRASTRATIRIVGINRYRLEKEDPIDILAVDNTAVREAQIKRSNELRANRDEAKVKAALAAITECVRTKKGNLLELAVEAAKVRASLGEISDACEEVVGRYKAVIRSISGVYSAEVKNDEVLRKAKQMAEQFAKRSGRQPRIMIA